MTLDHNSGALETPIQILTKSALLSLQGVKFDFVSDW